MREWLESYRPVRQRTVRSETTKDKAGALPPAVYRKPPESSELVSFEASLPEVHDDYPSENNTIQLEDAPGMSITFVSDSSITEVALGTALSTLTSSTKEDSHDDEYESDSDDSTIDIEDFDLPNNNAVITRSGRQVKAWTKFDI